MNNGSLFEPLGNTSFSKLDSKLIDEVMVNIFVDFSWNSLNASTDLILVMIGSGEKASTTDYCGRLLNTLLIIDSMLKTFKKCLAQYLMMFLLVRKVINLRKRFIYCDCYKLPFSFSLMA